VITASEAVQKYGRYTAFYCAAGALGLVRVIKLKPVTFEEAEFEAWIGRIGRDDLRKILVYLKTPKNKSAKPHTEETPALPAPVRRRGRPPKSGALYSSTAGSRPAKDHGNRKNHDQEVMP